MAETKETNPEARAKLIAAAHEVVTAIAGSAADDIVLVPPRGVPKTSSGKVRRSSAKELYETGRTDVKQQRRVAADRAARDVERRTHARRASLRRIGDTLYAGWWYLVTALGLVAAFITTMILPTLSMRWSALRGIARTVLALTGIRVNVTGVENLPQRQRRDPVQSHELHGCGHHRGGAAGHAGLRRQEGIRRASPSPAPSCAGSASRSSSASMPPRASRTPTRSPAWRRKAGCSCSSRKARSRAAPACSASTWARSRSRPTPNLPVVPGILRGVRTLLRGDQWFPRRTAIDVVIEQPIQPTGTDFTAMLALRDAARAAMLKHVGEPDLGRDLEKPPAPA